ncbi:uncharacterized protein TNCV_3947651 [Trichonephila clavipes]|nr:uncharacterized protein TNCV_3947651 [Trichonephila clavipes]
MIINNSPSLKEVVYYGCEKVDFLSTILQKDMSGMYPVRMFVESSSQEMVLPQEEQVPSGHVALLRGKTTVFGIRLLCIVLRMQKKFELQLVPQ